MLGYKLDSDSDMVFDLVMGTEMRVREGRKPCPMQFCYILTQKIIGRCFSVVSSIGLGLSPDISLGLLLSHSPCGCPRHIKASCALIRRVQVHHRNGMEAQKGVLTCSCGGERNSLVFRAVRAADMFRACMSSL